MKKGVFLSSALLVGVLALSGCNVFQSMDKATGDDKVTTAKYEAKDALNSGDYQKALDKATEVKDTKYPGVNSYEVYKALPADQQSEYLSLQTIRAEASLGKAGVNALDIVSKLQDVTQNPTTAAPKRASSDDSVNRITDIVTSIDAMSVEQAVAIYNTFLASDTTTLTPTEKEGLKSTYQTAGIAVALKTAKKIIYVFDVNEDKTVNAADMLNTTSSGAVTVGDSTKLNNINARWKSSKTEIIDGLVTTVNYLDIALGSDLGQKAVKVIEDTKTTLKNTDDIGASDFNKIINNTLAGK